jgi:AcrR family transcriptional regulator
MTRSLSKTAHESILTAFVRLMEKHSIDDITTDAIAKEAGASKTTLYKHWGHKEKLLIDVIARLVASQPLADSGDFRADAIQILRNMFVPQKRGLFGKAWPSLFSYSISHPEFCAAVHRGLLDRAPKHTLIGIIRAASAAGELQRDVDPEFVLDLLAGPLMHHRFLHGSVPAKLPEQVVSAVWKALK